MKRYFSALACAMCLVIFGACEKDYVKSDSGTTDESSSDDVSVHEADADYVWDSNSVVNITLNGTSISADGNGVTISGTKATITAAGNYKISGTLTDGQIIVSSPDEATTRLILDGASITCSSSAPLYVQDAEKVIVVLNGNTQNYLTDGAVYQGLVDNEPNAALFSKADLSFYGDGALTVKGNYADGISGKDGLVIKSGTISVTSADDGIRGKDYLIVHGGNLTVKASGDGLKSDNEDNVSLGYVQIDSCRATVTSGGDAIAGQTNVTIGDGTFVLTSGGGSSQSASSSISSKGIKGNSVLRIDGGGFTINSADDAIHSNGDVIVNAGTLEASTADDGIHGSTSVTFNGGSLTVLKSYEAFESPLITINGGNVSLLATNDGFNATKGTVQGGTESNDNSYLYINGGTIAVACSKGDAIDSNGNIVMTAGVVVANGPLDGVEEAVDYNGSFVMKGGFFIGAGSNSNMTKAMSSSSTQKNLYLTTSSKISSTTLLHIQDADGADVLTFMPKNGGYKFLFSSSELVAGSTYSIYTGGTYTGGSSSNGVYSGGTYASSGSAKKSFSVSSSGSVTTVSF